MPAVRATRDADFNPIRVTRIAWNHAPDSCALEMFRTFPKREFAHFNLALFNKNLVFYIFENEIDMGINEWAWLRAISLVRSLTCDKHRATNCYSVNNIWAQFTKPIL